MAGALVVTISRTAAKLQHAKRSHYQAFALGRGLPNCLSHHQELPPGTAITLLPTPWLQFSHWHTVFWDFSLRELSFQSTCDLMGAFRVSLRRKLLTQNLTGTGDVKSPFQQLKPPSIYCADSTNTQQFYSCGVFVCFPVAT